LFDLKGKTALVTGGNGGIGLGMAKGLAQAGARVAIAGRDKAKNSQALKSLPDSVSLEADLRDEKACRAMVDEAARRLGRLDILVNNAGTNVRKRPEEYSLEEWKLVLDTNLTSAFVASQAAYVHLKRAGGGKIVNIGSMMSIFGASFVAPYGASKGGIVQLTRALACAWAKDNIQVNAVLPGWIDTALTQRAAGASPGICPASRFFPVRPPRTSLPAPQYRSTAATPPWGRPCCRRPARRVRARQPGGASPDPGMRRAC
jgi:2-deoxy-D-gluconate 3-dehydrogenase